MWLSGDEQRLWRDYLDMTARLQSAMHRQLQQSCGLSLADYDVLVVLSERGPLRIGELGGVLGWEQSRLSHQLRRMRDRDLVLRSDSAADGRGAVVDLTGRARAELSAAAPGHAELVRSVVFDGMTAVQQRSLQTWMSRVLRRLE